MTFVWKQSSLQLGRFLKLPILLFMSMRLRECINNGGMSGRLLCVSCIPMHPTSKNFVAFLSSEKTVSINVLNQLNTVQRTSENMSCIYDILWHHNKIITRYGRHTPVSLNLRMFNEISSSQHPVSRIRDQWLQLGLGAEVDFLEPASNIQRKCCPSTSGGMCLGEELA